MRVALKTAADRERFAQMWKDGASVKEMAAAFGCTKDTVSGWRARLGLPPRTLGHNQGKAAVSNATGQRIDQMERARAMLAAGLSTYEIRRMVGQ